MARQCVVLRKFGGPEGREYQIGELVDVEEWRHAERLIATRHLRPASAEEIANAVEVDETFVARPKVKKKKHRVSA
jgi:predicted phosphoribosyltransferase